MELITLIRFNVPWFGQTKCFFAVLTDSCLFFSGVVHLLHDTTQMFSSVCLITVDLHSAT